MHMADALLSPVVGGVMTAASAAAIGYAVKKTAADTQENLIPMMGVMGAFIFAGQMINFTIPGTGSSGHIGGGILLAALLGPYPALLTLAPVLLIQCLFFADGGLLAYGCNVFNLGVIPCFFAYPLIFRAMVKSGIQPRTILPASVAAVVTGLQAGAFAVVLQTLASGVTELPFKTFVLVMQPIHLAIGVAEGIVTAAVLCYVQRVQPEILDSGLDSPAKSFSAKKTLLFFAALTLVAGGLLSLFASSNPDGLEWAMEKTAGKALPERSTPVHEAASGVVEATAFMPDYAFTDNPQRSGATAAAGIAGSLITLVFAGGTGWIIYRVRKKRPAGIKA